MAWGLALVVLPRFSRVGPQSVARRQLDALDGVREAIDEVIGPSILLVLTLSSIACVFGGIVRGFARERAWRQRTDPLAGSRAWCARRDRLVTLLLAACAITWGLALVDSPFSDGGLFEWLSLMLVIPGLVAVGRVGLRALLAPTLEPSEADEASAQRTDEIEIRAVAVTAQTRSATAVLSLFALGAVICAATLPVRGALLPALVAFSVSAPIGIAAFLRTSRIWVGVDGVRVGGTSLCRFYAYRDLEDASRSGCELFLFGDGGPVLKLQLHGAEAARADVLLTEIRRAIQLARERRGLTIERYVETTQADQILRAAAGACDFRHAPLSRDELWEVVEGPAVSSGARAAAAAALTASRAPDSADRARLRLLGARCADLDTRSLLEHLAADEQAEPPATKRSRRSPEEH